MSIYDIKIKSWDGSKEDVLSDYKGKVTLIINTTADCGNAPQFGIIEEIYRKYKDQGFEVLAVPTNDYCGTGITYGDYACGIKNAAESKEYAEETYDVTYNFTELVTSYPCDPVSDELNAALYAGRTEPFPRQLEEGETPHPLYQTLCETTHTKMGGNFEKFLINKDGQIMRRYPNGTLMEYSHMSDPDFCDTAENEYALLCKDIEEVLATNASAPDHRDTQNGRDGWRLGTNNGH